MRHCRSCGGELIEGAAFCGYCGASVEDVAEETAHKADIQGEPVSVIPPVIQVTFDGDDGEAANPAVELLSVSKPQESPDEQPYLNSAILQSDDGAPDTASESVSRFVSNAGRVTAEMKDDVMEGASRASEAVARAVTSIKDGALAQTEVWKGAVEMKDSVAETVSRASEAIIHSMESFKDTGSTQTETENGASLQQSAPTASKAQVKSSPLQDTIATDELWTWLKKDARRQIFFLEDQEPIAEVLYMAAVAKKLGANNVPATIERRSIRWDRGDTREPIYLVRPNTSAVNPLSCCLQLSHVGKYVFSEQKTFMAPPKLPETPEKPVDVPSGSSIITIAIGAVAFLIWLFCNSISSSISYYYDYGYRSGVSGVQMVGIVALLVGIVSLCISYMNRMNVSTAKEHNKKVAKQVEAWDKAWSDWEDSVFIHSFQETTHGQVSRIYQAVFDCIRQVNEELFQTESTVDEREDTSMSTIEAQIARRKESYR